MKEILFDELTAKDVAERLRVRAEIDAYLNAIALTVARMSGAKPDDGVSLNRAGTGIVLSPPRHPQGRENWETPSEAIALPDLRHKAEGNKRK